MKTCFTLFFSFGILTGTMAQRTMDLTVEIVSPESNTSVPFNSPFNVMVEVTNQGSENLNAGDSLYFYPTINGIQPANMEYFTRTGYQINAGESQTYLVPLAFSHGYENSDVEYCLEVKPVNAADPIVETSSGDNKDCINLHVESESTAGMNGAEIGEFIVSPNPAKGLISLTVQPDNGKIQLVSLDGKQVVNTQLNGPSLDVSEIPNGVYLLNFELEGAFYSKRIIISN